MRKNSPEDIVRNFKSIIYSINEAYRHQMLHIEKSYKDGSIDRIFESNGKRKQIHPDDLNAIRDDTSFVVLEYIGEN